MLLELRIRNFAIIDALQLRFDAGFSVLTGETGAGKSIIVDAVDLILGGRADSSAVRAGTERALIEAVFRPDAARRAVVDPLLEREGLEGDDPELLLLAREVRVNGRNVCRVNGRSVTLTLLREVAEGLVDIHGQSEHLSLLRPRAQLHLLDRYAELEALRGEVAALVARVRRVRRELDDLLLHDQERAHRADLLKFQIGEIEAAALEQGEEEPLLEERARLANAEELAELVTKALLALEEGEGETPAAMDLLGVAFRALDGLARVDASLEPQLELAESANYQVQELVRSLHDYEEQIEYNPRRLRVVEDRLALIHRLKRKYGETVEEVLAYGERAAQELNSLTHSDERVSELRAQEARLLNELSALAPQLSRGRREAAQRLAQAIERELQDLRMAGARFGVAFEWRPDPEGVPLPEDVTELRFQVTGEGVERSGEVEDDGPSVAFDGTGIDQIEFLVSANPGEPLKPMAKIASGGETARLMLSLKAVLSRADETATLIFDEIDQGIGGRVGATVGEKLWRLTEAASPTETRHQVLCVTHLPQLAGFGDVHFHVEKVVAGERTVTRVRRLQGPERVDELVQMLGARGEAGQRSAALMLEQVDEVKQRARQSSS